MSALASLPSGILIIQRPLFGSVQATWHCLSQGVVLELLLNPVQFRGQQVGHSSENALVLIAKDDKMSSYLLRYLELDTSYLINTLTCPFLWVSK